MTVRRAPLLLAGALTLLSLGLPWGASPGVAGYYVPGASSVVVGADGYSYVDITPGYYAPGFAGSTFTGADHLMRVTALVAIALLWAALRRGSHRLAVLAVVVGAVALPVGIQSGGVQSGRICYLAALLLTAYAIRPLFTSQRDPQPA